MKTNIQGKSKLVNSVFSQVNTKYDLMNDIMSFGIHRIWKNKFIDWMRPQPKKSLIDVASGTGDIAKLFYKKSKKSCQITCVEPNLKMFKKGQLNLKNISEVNWINASAEKLPIPDNTFDYYSISFGMRNVTNIDSALKEAFRVLKPGGRFMCLEFSKVDNEILKFVYDQYSKTIPTIGKLIVGSEKPYEYLVESIKKFYNQEQLAMIIKRNGFSEVSFRNLTNGIAAIHSGWKI
tara:strand:+ start:264 stop:968 length:705 start_codon:yes stop_codon:yes gene_type:complete